MHEHQSKNITYRRIGAVQAVCYVHVEQMPVLSNIQTYTNPVFMLPPVLEGKFR